MQPEAEEKGEVELFTESELVAIEAAVAAAEREAEEMDEEEVGKEQRPKLSFYDIHIKKNGRYPYASV